MTIDDVVCSAMGTPAFGARRPAGRWHASRAASVPDAAGAAVASPVTCPGEPPTARSLGVPAVREFSTPADHRGPRHRATSPTTSSRNARERRRRRGVQPPHRATAGRTSPRPSSSTRCSAVAKGLVAAGIEAGDRVALISKTRYEWTLLDYAIWFAGAVTVPVYETSSAEQIGWILRGLRRPRRGRRGRRPPRPGRRGARRTSTELNHVWSLDRQRRRRARPGSAPTSPTTSSRSGVRRPTPLDLATLIYTSRHDRPAQGLHAHPRQLHVRARRRRRRAATSSSTPTTPRRCCSCRWPTSSPGSSRSAA